MQKVERARQARRELDRKYAAADVASLQARPRHGWIRAVREGLGMSQRALAVRLGVSPAAVAKLERSEAAETISLGKLAEVARQLDCSLVYAMVPNESLEATVQRRARQLGTEIVAYTAATMALENQAVDAAVREEAVARAAATAIEGGRLWPSREG